MIVMVMVVMGTSGKDGKRLVKVQHTVEAACKALEYKTCTVYLVGLQWEMLLQAKSNEPGLISRQCHVSFVKRRKDT